MVANVWCKTSKALSMLLLLVYKLLSKIQNKLWIKHKSLIGFTFCWAQGFVFLYYEFTFYSVRLLNFYVSFIFVYCIYIKLHATFINIRTAFIKLLDSFILLYGTFIKLYDTFINIRDSFILYHGSFIKLYACFMLSLNNFIKLRIYIILLFTCLYFFTCKSNFWYIRILWRFSTINTFHVLFNILCDFI